MEIETILTEYAEMYRSPLGAEQLVLYLDALDGCTATEVRASMRQLARDAKWMPRPAEILEVIRSARAESNRRTNSTSLSAAAAKPSRSKWRVPAGVSIMEHIEHLRRDGMSTDEIAEALCGPEQPESESRYRCRYCRDTRFVTVFRRSVLDAVYNGREHRHDTGAVPCCCAAADEIAQSKRWNGTRFSASSHVITTGDHREDTRSLERYRSTRLASKRHSAFDGYDTPVEELF